MAKISVIIPTYRRASTLKQCLKYLADQTMADDIEVIVVSDGHDDETADLFIKNTWPMPVKFLEIEKSQQGKARNRGVKEAQGPICLFIGDDIFLDKQCCALHWQAHRKLETIEHKPTAVLGFTTWDPAVGITPVMRWLEQSGWQFGYPQLNALRHQIVPSDKQHLFSYTSHISVSTDTAKQIAFREDVNAYGWEDMEWGLRLRDADVRLFYEPDAKAVHHHFMSLEQSLQRMETIGKSAVTVSKLNPAFDRVPKGLKLLTYHLSSLLPTMVGKHRKAFLKGLNA